MNRFVHYYKIVSQHKNPVRLVLSRLLRKFGLSELFLINRNGYRLRFFNSSISQNLWIDAEGRSEDELFFHHYLRENDKVVDVGANIGNLSITSAILLKSNYKQPSVLSIEPNPEVFAYLNRNIELNKASGVIKTLNIALGDRKGEVSLSSNKDDGMKHVVLDSNMPSIKMERLDSLKEVSDFESIALLKVDVEGFEMDVFKGATGILSKVDTIYFEYNHSHTEKFQYAFSDLYEFLKPFGFDFYLPDVAAKRLKPIQQDFDTFSTVNVLALKSNLLASRMKTWELEDLSPVMMNVMR